MKWMLFASVLGLGLTGCLKTRNEVREAEQKQVIQQEVTKLQRTNADVAGRFMELEEELRGLRGRIEVLEHRGDQGSKEVESAKKFTAEQSIETNKKLILLQEGLSQLEKNLQQLSVEVTAFKTEQAAEKAAAAAHSASSQAKKGSYDVAQEFFDQKDWKKAILNYQKYRDDNPNGKKIPDATYKMGVAFQELGLKDEAKTFFDELVSKYPNTNEARKAKIRLKSLKK